MKSENNQILYYVHDPMCSWCYAFKPLWADIKQSLPDNIEIRYLVGGLAPDSDAPMPQAMQDTLQSVWQHISQAVPGTDFNYDFWTNQQPRRSTYPACRAVLAAKYQDSSKEDAMIAAIQQVYYRDAKNPSDNEILIAAAASIGLDTIQFTADLVSPEIEQQLIADIQFARSIGGHSFPSLFLFDGQDYKNIQLSYTDKSIILNQVLSC